LRIKAPSNAILDNFSSLCSVLSIRRCATVLLMVVNQAVSATFAKSWYESESKKRDKGEGDENRVIAKRWIILPFAY
jgi:hypothetical protein